MGECKGQAALLGLAKMDDSIIDAHAKNGKSVHHTHCRSHPVHIDGMNTVQEAGKLIEHIPLLWIISYDDNNASGP